jgi:predicted short-subunit dehydrogenase-like oxidoreductase (DUF2520 family)
MAHTASNRAVMRVAIVGDGRLGTAFARALIVDGTLSVAGPFGRGAEPPSCDVVLLCVPDGEIADVAAAIAPGALVGHCSGATGLEPLHPHEAFSLHPLMTVTEAGADFSGATAAIDATSPRAFAAAEELARALQMRTIRVEAEDRPAYHTAASMASNFLVTLEAAAEQIGAGAGLEREMLVPLVRATVDNWATLGGRRALTGPIARGDEITVTRQRNTVIERAPELLPLFDALTTATRMLAA